MVTGLLTPVKLDELTGLVSGYLALWGSADQRDAYGTWFDYDNPPDLHLDLLPIPIFVEHTGERIGRVTAIEVDDTGVAFSGTLEKSDPRYRVVAQAILDGKYFISSGTSERFAEFDEDGRFVSWPLSDVSLTRSPAEPRMRDHAVEIRSDGGRDDRALSENAVSIVRDNLMNLEEVIAQLLAQGVTPEQIMAAIQAATDGQQAPPATASDPVAAPVLSEQPPADTGTGDLVSLVTELLAAQNATPDTPEAAPARSADVDALVGAVARLSEIMANTVQHNGPTMAPPEPVRSDDGAVTPVRAVDNRGNGPRITDVRDMRFDHLDAEDMVAGHVFYDAVRATGRPLSGLSDGYIRAMCEKVARRLDTAPQDAAIRNLGIATRANELVNTAQAGFGAEWIGVYYETALWEEVRHNPMWEAMKARGMAEFEVPRGYESVVIPVEGADPTFYTVGETTGETNNTPTRTLASSKPGTAKKTITPSKLGAAIVFSGEFDEGSLIPALQEMRRKLTVATQEEIEKILLNGDTDTTTLTNINTIDGTPTGDEDYLLLDGMLKLGLVTNTANSLSAGGSLSEDDFAKLFMYLGTNGVYAIDRSKIMYIVDANTHNAMLRLANLKTVDKAGTNATVQGGMVDSIYGANVLVSGQMALANTAGKVQTAVPAGNTTGRALLVRPDRFKLAWWRRATTEIERYARSDAFEIVQWLRVGLGNRDNEAAAVIYNIGV